MESNSQIRDIVVRYWKGELSKEERSKIMAWADEHPKNKIFLEHFDSIEPAAQEALKQTKSRETIWEKITNEAPELKARKIFTLPRIATVAAAIIILFVGGYFVFQAYSPNETATADSLKKNQKQLPDILPIDQGAVLELADGTQVPIDSAESILAKQGTTTITKKNGGIVYEGSQKDDAVYLSTIQTFKGRKLTITLPDKTIVSLNVESKLQVPSKFTGDYREVTLLEGEAYFEVAHNKKQPFHVKVVGQEIAVTGTKFNVKAYPNELEVKSTLFEGGIKVKADKDKVEFDLKPGYELVKDSGDNFKIVKNADLEKAAAWRKNLFLFRGATIQEIMRELSRHYDIEVRYTTKNSQRFNAEIPSDLSIQTIFQILEATKGVRFKIEGRTIIII